MHFYSTRNIGLKATIEEALLAGIASDGGLFMPSEFPLVYAQIEKADSFHSIAFKIIAPFLQSYFGGAEIHQIIKDSFNFEVPIVSLTNHLKIVELFHGPTLAFKDFGGQFMANSLSMILKRNKQRATILVATSGDTGGAVANGFFDKENIEVVILYPKGKVSKLQELQLTTFGKNITAICVDGTFDDCQRLVKIAFADSELTKQLGLSSANSINIGRLLPQMSYYAYASHQHFLSTGEKPTIVVPSGNFGNITAGLFVKKMGFPIGRFVAATNANDVVPIYLANGTYSPRPSVQTLSNAMDVGAPSNLERINCLFNDDVTAIKNVLTAVSVSDLETKNTMLDTYTKHHYIADPHTAVGIHAANEVSLKETTFVMSTAHPSKFKQEVESILEIDVALPKQLSDLLDKESEKVEIDNDFEELSSFLLMKS
jgi:threonine synthase